MVTIRRGWKTVLSDLLFSADNTLDVGASGANRPRTGYFGTSVVVPTATLNAGSGTATYTPSGVIHTDSTTTGTDADTNEKTLWTYTLPADTLSANGKTLRIRVAGYTAGTATNKTLQLYFGGTSILSTGVVVLNGVYWEFEAVIVRTGASAQVITAKMQAGTNGSIGPEGMENSTLTKALTSDQIIKFTGTNGTGNLNDIVYQFAVVEVLN